MSDPDSAGLLAACKVALPRLELTVAALGLSPDLLGWEHPTWVAYETIRKAIAQAEGGES